ncbi:MAG: hypothetical protein ACLSVD_09525 [Eggerthellaceae bacterium]
MKALILTGERAKGSSCPPSEYRPATCASASSRPSAYAELSPRLHRDGARQGQLLAGGNLEL